jgi:hypothetical protein
MTGEFLDSRILEGLVDKSLFFALYPDHLESLGQEIARMNFYASSEIFSGLYLGLEKKFGFRGKLPIQIHNVDASMILKGLNNVDNNLVNLWERYGNKTDLRIHPSNLSWFPDTNVHLGEQLSGENSLLIAYILNSACEDYLLQSQNDSNKGYLKLSQAGKEIGDSLHYVSRRLKTFEIFR